MVPAVEARECVEFTLQGDAASAVDTKLSFSLAITSVLFFQDTNLKIKCWTRNFCACVCHTDTKYHIIGLYCVRAVLTQFNSG